ncbi:MAG: protein translocase subunit SecF [Anaerolineales bacterium]|nr:protein translocase subunit SecF [Anaerolineales bacterium]MBX3037845.1 protein translocase subunit SecF [Anaerolineales bacterium]
MNILVKRYYFFAFSLILIISGLTLLAINGVPLSLDFTGGTLFEVQFEDGKTPDTATILSIYEDSNIDDAQITSTEIGSVIIRSSFLTNEVRDEVLKDLKTASDSEVTVIRFDSVGPSIGRQVTQRAAIAVAVASLLVVLFIIWSFRKVENAFRYGVCAILAMLHDIAIIFSITGIGAYFFNWQVDSLFLTALLTVIGFSMQDTIVVFDRIRENSNILRRLEYEKLVNHSIVQTLQRSINTQLMTVEFLLLALALFGGVTLQEFAIVLLVGLLSGTYSSIFVAAPILVVWEKREWQTWFGRSANI